MIENSAALVNSVVTWIGAAGWAELAEAFFVLMSVVGQHFVSKRQVKGFYFWVIGNLTALILFAYLGRWMTLALYVYFLWKSVEGIRVWRELDRQSSPGYASGGASLLGESGQAGVQAGLLAHPRNVQVHARAESFAPKVS